MNSQKNSEPLIEFHFELPKLSKNERQVLDLLAKAGRLIVPLYKLQEDEKYPGANFYPHDATKEEIEKAATKNPQILSPYTIVERVEGKLVAVPYHQKYAEYLKPISDKLLEAAKLCQNREFKKGLVIQAEALMSGTYEAAFSYWMQAKPYILDISIGPNDYFDDHLFSVKMSYQAWVGVVDKDQTKKLIGYKDLILSTRRKAVMSSEIIEGNKDAVGCKVIDAVLFSGLIARTTFVGVNHPIDQNIKRKTGSEVILFKQANTLRVKEQILPTFKRIFSEGFRQGFDEEDLRRGEYSYVALHELAHSYLNYKNATNLRNLLPVIEELAATALGMRVGGSLLLRDLITTKRLKSMLIAYLCRSIYLEENKGTNKSLHNHTVGGAIFINYMLESGALKQSKGLAIPNFTKMFISLHDLSVILEKLLSFGTKKDAEKFVAKYKNVPNL